MNATTAKCIPPAPVGCSAGLLLDKTNLRNIHGLAARYISPAAPLLDRSGRVGYYTADSGDVGQHSIVTVLVIGVSASWPCHYCDSWGYGCSGPNHSGPQPTGIVGTFFQAPQIPQAKPGEKEGTVEAIISNLLSNQAIPFRPA